MVPRFPCASILMTSDIVYKRSPNQEDRAGAAVVAVVLHYDASPSDSATVNWLCDPASKVSAHYHIGRSGAITQMVSLDRVAWHAGRADIPLRDGEYINSGNRSTIGIEMANLGLLQKTSDGFYYMVDGSPRKYQGASPIHAALTYPDGRRVEGWWEPFAESLLASLTSVLLAISAVGYTAATKNLVGHDEVARPWGRKVDPGPSFPWDRYHREVTRPLVSLLLP